MYRCFHEQAEFSHPQIQQLSYPLFESGNLFRCKTDHKPWQRNICPYSNHLRRDSAQLFITFFIVFVFPYCSPACAMLFEYELRNLTMHRSSSIPLNLSGGLLYHDSHLRCSTLFRNYHDQIRRSPIMQACWLSALFDYTILRTNR